MDVMKKIKLKSSVLSGLLSLFLLSGASCFGETTLNDITKSYLGEYECTQAQYGEKNYLEMFSYLRIELEDEGVYTLRYKIKDGEIHQISGTYVYDLEKETILLQTHLNGGMKKTFPMSNGVLTITAKIGNKNLNMKFEQN